jgi:hypothetical protein
MTTSTLSKLSLVAVIAALTACATHLRPNEVSKFVRADANHDGKLSEDECSDYIVRRIFDSRDANHDDKLTWEEWNVEGAGKDKSKFKARDTNHDGVVTLDEAKAHARKRHLYQKEFREADQNHDGFLSPKEIEDYYASKEGPMR